MKETNPDESNNSKEEIDIPDSPDKIHSEHLKQLQKLDKQTKDMEDMDGLPQLPEFEDEEEKKEYIKSLKKGKWKKRIQELFNLREEQKNKREKLEKDLVYEKSLKERFWESIPFGKNDFIQVGLIHDTGRIEIKEVGIDDRFFEVDEDTYRISHDAVYKYNGKPISFYFKGNPFPISFDFEEHETLINSEALYNSFNAKIVSDLLSSGGMMTKTQKWTVGTIIALGVVGVMIFSVIKGGASNLVFAIPIKKIKDVIENV